MKLLLCYLLVNCLHLLWNLKPVSSLVMSAIICSVTSSCPTFCRPMDCGLPGSSAHGIFQARMLEWVAIFSSRGSSQPKDQTRPSCSSCTGRQILYQWATGKPGFRLRRFQFLKPTPCTKIRRFNKCLKFIPYFTGQQLFAHLLLTTIWGG